MLVLLCGYCRVLALRVSLAVVFSCCTVSVLCAETVKPPDLLTPAGMLHIRKPDSLQMSPDGRRVAFTVEEPIQGAVPHQNIWVLDLETRESRQFTTSRAWETQPRWRPDGKALAFLSNRSGKPQVYVIPIGGGEAKAVTHSEKGVGPYAWSPDGSRIAYVAQEPDTDEEKKRVEDRDDPHVVTRDYYSRAKDPQFWVVDVESSETRQVTHRTWRLSNGDTDGIYFTWHPAGDRLLISATEDPRTEVFTSRLHWLRLSDGKTEEFAAPRGSFGQMRFSPDGKTLAFLGAREDGPETDDLFVQALAGGPARNLTGDKIDLRIRCYEWQNDGTLIVLAETGFVSALYRCSPDGKVEQVDPAIVPATHWAYAKTFAANGEAVVFVGETSTQAPELWVKSRAEKAVQVSKLNGCWKDVPLRPMEVISYKSFDGLQIEAGLVKPAGRSAPYPLVVLVHGGPSAHWADHLEPWGQVLAARGFAVAYPNIRGSTGYSYDFMTKVRKDTGGADFKDVMALVDLLIHEGTADPDRLGIGGWSYGGYMSAWAVTQTDRFKAAVSGAPMTNLVTEFLTEESWVNYYDAWTLGTPYENWDLLTERSPVARLSPAVKTPTLILCGEKDVIDPLGQCLQFHRGLKHYGVETELVIYPRVGHAARMPEEKLRVDVARRLVGWFEKHLGAK
ncbi:MAG: prolyl oligopeptidase family serine peptidase [Acidobacteriota bacterium]